MFQTILEGIPLILLLKKKFSSTFGSDMADYN